MNYNNPHGAVLLLLSILLIASLFSCTREPQSQVDSSVERLELREQAAVEQAVSLYSSLFSSSLRSNEIALEVESVSYSPATAFRSDGSAEVCVVNFKNDNGYVVMIENKDQTMPMAIVQEGSFDFNKLRPIRQDSVMHFLISTA